MWINAESDTKPAEQDTMSSKVFNYDRRNIEQSERELEDGTKVIVFSYEENKVFKTDWDNYLALKSLQEQQETTMSAVQDLIMSTLGV